MDMIVGDDEKIDGRKERLFIKAKKLMLDQADILYIESRAKKVEIHTVGSRESMEIYAAMKGLEEQLGQDFYRCHRTFIVNMAYITEYGKDYINIANGDTVYIAKKKYGDCVKAYQNYLRNGGVSSV